MKIITATLFLYFSIFAACNTYAGNNSLTASFPTPSGSYNKIMLNTQPGSSCTANNTGTLFTDTNGNLEICANANGLPVQVPYGETCFNRFCSCCTSGAACPGGVSYCTNPASCTVGSGFTANPCPLNYTQGKYTNSSSAVVPINDSFTGVTGAVTYTVYSTLCCYSPLGSTTSTVLPTQ